MGEVSVTVEVIVVGLVVILLLCAIGTWRLNKYIMNLNEVQTCLEASNDLMKQCIDDSSMIIKKQDDEIRRLNGEEVHESNHIHHYDVLQAIKNGNARETAQNREGWNLYLVKRNVNAPALTSMYDLQSAVVIANSPSDAIDILKRETMFNDDEWWDVVPIHLNETSRGIIMSRDGIY